MYFKHVYVCVAIRKSCQTIEFFCESDHNMGQGMVNTQHNNFMTHSMWAISCNPTGSDHFQYFFNCTVNYTVEVLNRVTGCFDRWGCKTIYYHHLSLPISMYSLLSVCQVIILFLADTMKFRLRIWKSSGDFARRNVRTLCLFSFYLTRTLSVF